MARSDLVVCRGGNGTIYQAMAAGVPIMVKTVRGFGYKMEGE
jgi:UDP:flavonoid glycosyltransferase YjiC (YdhE family)